MLQKITVLIPMWHCFQMKLDSIESEDTRNVPGGDSGRKSAMFFASGHGSGHVVCITIIHSSQLTLPQYGPLKV